MEGNVKCTSELIGGCQHTKTFRFSKACGSQMSTCTRVPQRACETAGPTLFLIEWVWWGKYVLLLVVEGPQHPCSEHLPFSSSCLLTSGRCQDCFPWSTSLGSASFFNIVVEELLFQKLGNFSKCLSYLFAVAGKVLLLAVSLFCQAC